MEECSNVPMSNGLGKVLNQCLMVCLRVFQYLMVKGRVFNVYWSGKSVPMSNGLLKSVSMSDGLGKSFSCLLVWGKCYNV